MKKQLNEAMAKVVKESSSPAICRVEIVEKTNLMNYHPNAERFLKVTTQMPSYVATCRRVIEADGSRILGCRATTFESNVDFVIRFMNDRQITGCSWVTIPAGQYDVVPLKERKTVSLIEVDTRYQNVVHHEAEGEWMAIPNFRIMSFDIEVGGEQDHFPTPEQDPVIEICVYVQKLGESEPMFSAGFVLNTCTPVVGSALYQFESERDLLLGFQKFVRFVDPDIITGYNIDNFDWPYLVNRANTIGCKDFCELGRYKGEFSKVKDAKKSIKALGKRDGKEVPIPGRVNFDMYTSINLDYKFRSYSLNFVSAHFLGDQKEDVHYSMISKLQQGSPQDRNRLVVYCLKDAYLPLRLMTKLLTLYTSIELSRVCKVPIKFLLTRGQQIRVFSQLLCAANKRNMIIPFYSRPIGDAGDDDRNVGYKGATVVDPKAGYYTNPIPTLDFASLYPSIMISHNICYCTLVIAREIPASSADKFEKSPEKDVYFVKRETVKGVLPEILEGLLSARAKARALIKEEKDELTKNVLNCRQLALKVSANSVYGFTGTVKGKLPCLELSKSVTSFGRQMIQQTQNAVIQKYNVENGYKYNAEIIYGDTDSVMVNFGNISLAEAIELGKEAANYVTESFPKPIRLEFEKAYQPYLLISKKHYAGLLHHSADPNEVCKIDAKGIETVRRDNCRLVQNLLQKALDFLLIKGDKEKAIQIVKSSISDLLNDRIDLSFLVITKAISKEDYKGKQPHTELAARMAKRDPKSARYHLGDRVAYIITTSQANARACDKSEDPIYALKNGLQIDTKYYLENQLRKPLIRLFTPVLGETKVESLLKGEHTLHVKHAPLRIVPGKQNAGTLLGFVQVQETCVCGKSSIKKGKPPVCSQCSNRITEVYQEKLREYRYAEDEYTKLWTQCQRCQKSLMKHNICNANDCPIFYRRTKAQLDLEDCYKTLKKFDQIK